MKITFAHIDDAEQLKMITASSTYGVGLFTSISYWFCNLFGIECKMYDRKIELSKSSTIDKLIDKAFAYQRNSGNDITGIMDVQFQVHATTVFAYGIVYK